jgi:hypothetical protein
MGTMDAYLKYAYKAYYDEKDRKTSKQLNELVHILNGMKQREEDFLNNSTIRSTLDESVMIVKKKKIDIKSVINVKAKLLKQLKKEYGIISYGYMTMKCMAIGMAIGIPAGMLIGYIFFQTLLYFGFGVLAGMVIGMFVGSSLDKKAKKEGHVIDPR